MTDEEVRIIALDAKAWRSPDDFHEGVLAAIAAPAPHIRTSDAFAHAVVAAEAPFRIEIANLFAAEEATMEAVYAAFTALTLAGAKTRIDKDGVAIVAVSRA